MQITIEPVGYVRSVRTEPIDDHWNGVASYIELTSEYAADSLTGLADFSHVEIIYYFHQVDRGKIILKSEHPRENPAWPKVGIFAQRKRARPNLLGATIARLLRIDGRKVYLHSLDAIDGTPVIDIKPVFKEYLPQGKITQPPWVSELMKDYWE